MFMPVYREPADPDIAEEQLDRERNEWMDRHPMGKCSACGCVEAICCGAVCFDCCNDPVHRTWPDRRP